MKCFSSKDITYPLEAYLAGPKFKIYLPAKLSCPFPDSDRWHSSWTTNVHWNFRAVRRYVQEEKKGSCVIFTVLDSLTNKHVLSSLPPRNGGEKSRPSIPICNDLNSNFQYQHPGEGNALSSPFTHPTLKLRFSKAAEKSLAQPSASQLKERWALMRHTSQESKGIGSTHLKPFKRNQKNCQAHYFEDNHETINFHMETFWKIMLLQVQDITWWTS